MTESPPVLSTMQKQANEIIASVERELWVAVQRVLEEAHARSSEQLQAISFDEPLPPKEYYASVAHHRLFVLLSNGDPETQGGGDPQLAALILQSSKNFAEHYWGKANDD
jgi:hypothetical protein